MFALFTMNKLTIILKSQIMYQAFNEEITPWENEPHYNIFTIQYDEPRHSTMKKFSSQIQNRKANLKLKKKKKNKLKELMASPDNHMSMKNYVAQTISPKSQQELILFRSQKIKQQSRKLTEVKVDRSSLISMEKLQPAGSDFIIRKHERVKKFSKALFRQIKMDDIFRKLTQIQNPSHRQNISLPKIQIKI